MSTQKKWETKWETKKPRECGGCEGEMVVQSDPYSCPSLNPYPVNKPLILQRLSEPHRLPPKHP